MNYGFHELAEQEFFSVIEFYEEQQPGLGLRFSIEVRATIGRICAHPYAWASIDSKTRRCLTNRFPYGILYRIIKNNIQIMAIMHLHRKPDYWKGR